MSLLGSLEKFDLQVDNWCAYVERVEQYFIANGIDNEDKKRGILLTVIGSETYSLLRNLISPTKPAEKSFAQLVDTLKAHLNPTPIVIAERYKFYNQMQLPGESLHMYLAELRKMTEYCAFGNFLNDALRDRFVCGMGNSSIRKRLLTEKDLTLEKAVSVAVSMEASSTENELMKAPESLNAIADFRRRCYRCNDDNHLANKCRYKESICNLCKRKGHLARACRQGKSLDNTSRERNTSDKKDPKRTYSNYYQQPSSEGAY